MCQNFQSSIMMSTPVMLMQPEDEEDKEEDEEGKEGDEEDEELLAQAGAVVDQRNELVQVRTAKTLHDTRLMADASRLSDVKLAVRGR